jgi:hypothetical protein
MKERATNIDSTNHLHRSARRAGSASITPSGHQTPHQLCRGSLGYHALCATLGSSSSAGTDERSHYHDPRPDHRQPLDQETLAKLG